MNIALLTLSFWPVRGGMEYVVHDLANALQDNGHEVTVLAPRWKNLPREQDHRYRLVRFGWTFRGAFRLGINRWPLRREFGRLHRSVPFDVISSHSAYLATDYALSLKRKYRVPVVVTCHGHDIQRHPESGYGLRLDPGKNRRIQSNLRASDLAVSISPSIWDDLIEILPEEKIVSIPNGIHVDTGDAGPKPWLRQRVGGGSDVIVISVGRNVPKKSLDIGLEAFAVAVKKAPALRYVHIGRDGDSLNEQAVRLGVADRFDALGEQPRAKVLQAYRESDLFFSPAAVESFGIVTFEAMAAGLPSVVSDGPGNRDAITHGENGLVVPVDDVEAMARALVDLSADAGKRKAYGSSAMKSVERYSWPSVAEEYAAAFGSVRADGAGNAR